MIQDSMRFDLRRRRADVLTAAVLTNLRERPLDPGRLLQDVSRVLTEVFTDEGVEVLTDSDRAVLGLPPRSPDGWTADEIIAVERRRLDALNRPIEVVVPASQGGATL